MERIRNFDDFYDKKLKQYIDDLQAENKRGDRWGIGIMVFAFALIPVLIYGLKDSSGYAGKILVVLMVLLVGISAHNYAKISSAYESNFKDQVIKQIIEFIQPGLVYKPAVYMSSGYVNRSGLFADNIFLHDGDDMVEGTYRNVYFKCSELTLSVSGSKGKIIEVFHGLFFAAPINKRYAGGTYVYANTEERRLPAFDITGLVRLDCRNGVFENYHSVFTTNAEEAIDIMSAEMMNSITGFMGQIKRKLTVSFVAGMCYVAIPFSQELFEPPGPYENNREEIKEYFFTVLLMLSIINQLQLEKLQ